MPSADDVYITPASQKIEYYDSSSVVGKTYYSSPYMRIRSDASSGLAFEGNSGLHYFIRSSANNRLFVYNYADGSGYATYAANYLQLRDGSSNIEAYLVAGNGSFVSGNLGVGTNSPSGKFTVSGGASTLDNGSGVSLYLKNAGSTYASFDAYGSGVSFATPADMHVSGATGITLQAAANGIVLSPTGTSAGDTLPLRFRELAANGTATVNLKAPDSIASGIEMVLPAAAGTANQVLAIDSVSSGIMTLGFQNAGGSPGGSDTQVQFNNGGAFAGDADMTFDGTNLTLANDLIVGRKVKHNGDENNYIEFTTDDMDFNIDSKSFMRFTEVGTSGDKIVFNEGSNNIDFRIESDDNANMFFMDAGSNRIGIGTASPSQDLHVVGNGLFTGGLTVGDSAADTFATRGHTHLATLGNTVGVGLTNPASFSDKFSVQIDTNSGWPIGFTNAAEDVKGAIRTDQGDNYIAFASKSESDIRLFYNDNEANTALIVKGSGATAGNVGIGTTSPSYPLEVQQGTATYGIYMPNSNSRGISFGDTSNNGTGYGRIKGIGGSLFLGSSQVYTSFIPVADVNATLGSVSRRWSYFFTRFGQVGYDTSTTSTAQFGVSGASDKVPLEVYAYDTTTPAIHVTSGSNVGIGTDSPLSTRALHVSGRAYFDSDIISESYMQIDKDGSPGLLVGEGGDADIYYDGTDMYINPQRVGSGDLIVNNGNVGIGTTTPNSELDVFGDIRITNKNGSNPTDAGSLIFEEAGDNWGSSLFGFRINLEGSSNYLNFQSANQSTIKDVLTMTRDTARVGIGTTAPAAGLHISSTETSQLRITSGSNTQCDFKVSQYGGLVLDVNHTLEFDVTRHMDYKVGSSRLHRFHVGGTQTLQHELESGGGLLDFKGTQGKIWHAATPVAQIKDDTGIIMEDNAGIRNHVQTLATWVLDAATGNGQTSIQGFSKIQNINTAGIAAPELGAFSALQVVLPSATAGDEFIVVFGSNQSNLTGKNMILKANGSETINSGSSTGSVTYSKNTGESIHVVCYETGKWTVVSHV